MLPVQRLQEKSQKQPLNWFSINRIDQLSQGSLRTVLIHYLPDSLFV
jgi:hypothetical protein